MSQPAKPTAKPQPKTQQTEQPLPEADLEKVSGGKSNVSISDITITKHYDKSSPGLG